jgi:hypothetical protein
MVVKVLGEVANGNFQKFDWEKYKFYENNHPAMGLMINIHLYSKLP